HLDALALRRRYLPRNAVFSRRTSALLHLTICFPRIRWRKRITPRARKIAPDYRPRIPIQAVMEAVSGFKSLIRQRSKASNTVWPRPLSSAEAHSADRAK